MKNKITTILLVLMLVIGLSLLLYPTVSDYWNSTVQSHAVAGYLQEIAVMEKDEYEQYWNDAIAYNALLLERDNPYFLEEDLQALYYDTLDIAGNDIMGYVEIPSIDVELPIYHGTEEKVLQVAIGHLEWTSLPTGGESTHCVLSGHRGLPSARLFTDLDKLAVGDYFMLHVMDETLTYEVDQILIVEPDDTDALLIQEGKDLCTLFTCTPYGVNSHRLLVRGHRVDNLEEAQLVRVTADAVIVEKMVVVPFVLVPILFIMLIVLLVSTPNKKNGRKKK